MTPQVWQFARMAYRTQKNTYDYSCLIKHTDQDQPNEGNISSLQVFSGLCLVPGPMLSWTMEAQVIPGEQTCFSPLMRGRKDHPGTGNGIAKTQRHKQHGAVLQHDQALARSRWQHVENEAVVLGSEPIRTLFYGPWASRACASKWAEEWQDHSYAT